MTATRRNRQDLVPVEHAQLKVDDEMVDVLIEIGQKRAKILEAMKEALVLGDDEEALERARELTGLPSKRTGSAG
jgi:hypothetical protein